MKKIILIGIIAIIASFLVYNNLYAPSPEEADPKNNDPINDNDETNNFRGKLAIVIDDLGYNPDLNERLMELDEDLTVAILPFLKNTQKAVDDFSERDNFELILHMPMEPIGMEHIEDQMLMSTYSKEEMNSLLTEAISEMNGQVSGINNHKGSKFTSDEQKMREFLSLIKEKDLFFVDSYTINTSVGKTVAKEMSIPTAKRDVFLDYVDDEEAIREKLFEARDLALENGSAIAIGHHKEKTLKILKEELPELKKTGVKLVKISELLD